ncbi:unnamed protein product, partial [Ectocarpus sp. 12 AP-2014]
MPSGYRDVKLNPVVNEHLCEIQLHLREFYELKSDQRAVYERARSLNVATRFQARFLAENLSLEVLDEASVVMHAKDELDIEDKKCRQALLGVFSSMADLAIVWREQAKYSEADSCFLQSIEVWERELVRTTLTWPISSPAGRRCWKSSAKRPSYCTRGRTRSLRNPSGQIIPV